MLLACFFLSGTSALIYEVAWLRLLGLVFGGTTLATSTILAVFLGGLTLGSWIAGRLARRLRRPLLTYAILELLVALYALATPLIFGSAAFAESWRALAGAPGADQSLSFLMRFALSGLVLLPPTVLLGATLPIATQTLGTDGDRGAARLYAAGTFGGMTGVWLCGFALLPTLGTRTTLLVAACGSAMAAAIAWWLARRADASANASADASASASPGASTDSSSDARASIASPDAPAIAAPLELSSAATITPRERIALIVMALSSMGALAFEVAWTRLFSLVMGSSTLAFSTMLGAFLCGHAIGASIGAWRTTARAGAGAKPRDSMTLAIRSLRGASLLAVLLAGLIGITPWWLIRMHDVASENWPLFVTGRTWIALLIVIAPALQLGMVFPCLLAFGASSAPASARAGRLYASSTFGSIIGAFTAGFLLLPALDLFGVIVLAGATVLLASLILDHLSIEDAPDPATATTKLRWRFAPASYVHVGILGGVAVLAGTMVRTPTIDAGVSFYLHGIAAKSPEELRAIVAPPTLSTLFRADGRSATVTVQEDKTQNFRRLRTNGKVEGQVAIDPLRPAPGLDQATQKLLGLLPLLLHGSDSARALIIGHGSGASAGALLSSSRVNRLEIVEIEPLVFACDHYFKHANGDPLADQRTFAIADDGRNFLLTTRDRYDVIASQPAEPWLAGSAALFTKEHFELAAARLAPGGLYCQWIPCYGLPRDENLVIVRTFIGAFAHALAFHPHRSGEILLIGANDAIRIDMARLESRMAEPEVRRLLLSLGIDDPMDLLAGIFATRDELATIAGAGALNDDDRAWIEHRGPRAIYLADASAYAENFRALFAHAPAPQSLATDLDLLLLALAHLEDLGGGVPADPVRRVWAERHARAAFALADAAHRRAPAIASFAALTRADRALVAMGQESVAATSAARDPEAARRLPPPSRAEDFIALLSMPGALSPRETLELCNQAATAHPDNSKVLIAIADAAAAHGALDDAIARYQSALALDPLSRAANMGLAAALTRNAEPERARAALRVLETISPDDSALQVAIGRIEIELGHAKPARAALEIAPSLGPVTLDALFHLARARELDNDPHGAIKAYESYLASDSNSPQADHSRTRIAELKQALAR